MIDELNDAPCGYLSLSMNGTIQSINRTLLNALKYEEEPLVGKHINSILSVPAQLFYQFYFIHLVKTKGIVEEIYLSLISQDGKEIPVLINAKLVSPEKRINCILIPIKNRNQYENELIIARRKAETALLQKEQANSDLEQALQRIETKQKQLIDLNKENQQYKLKTTNELRLAKKIQETSLTEPIQNEQIRMEVFYKPSNELSGDIYGIYRLDDYRYGLIILDVMGHGISSAMVTMSLHTLFQSTITRGYEPGKVLKELDLHLHELFSSNEEARHYCTGICLHLDLKERSIKYSNAGHPAALWQSSDGTMQSLHTTSPPIGLFNDIDFKEHSFTFKGKGKLLLYTDGVDPIGTNHLQTLLHAYKSEDILHIKERISQSLDEEKKETKIDDQCFILIEVL